ncbi:MAG: aminotransferase class III-fold pyridoxal phosphate-dependent enzyme [Actinomycetia bacterium]|nr:aminotransferase class III-fold pyridoxal phosphate-dependent enzyme [Actinomycetes bacterium]MCP4960288.1 aminotransferase class III-fold pyridoxal phosphate-dependent enzyme [Actinomycetes bacterium]
MDERDSLIERRNQAFGDGAHLFYDTPVHLQRGEGVWLFDVDGTRYLDLYNNVPCVGHGNPRVAKAVADQIATLNVHNRYLHDAAIEYAERLMALHHDQITSMVMCCSGTEAVEVALTMARAATGRRGVICTDATYHGNSTQVGALTHLPVGASRGNAFSITTPQRFRPQQNGLSDAELCDLHLDELASTIAGIRASGEGVAALIMCSILANEGLPNAPSGFFVRAAEMVRAAGGLVVADEVQAGFARSGNWWGYQTSGFEPDIVVMGKPMGNGIPVSAAAANHSLVSQFREQFRYFNTYASSPVQAAAGNAVLDEIIERGLVEQVARVGREVSEGLVELQANEPRMGDIRGHGLFLGIDWVQPHTTDPDPAGAKALVEALKRRGMLLGQSGQHGNVLKIRPPLVFDSEHAGLFLGAFEAALADVDR